MLPRIPLLMMAVTVIEEKPPMLSLMGTPMAVVTLLGNSEAVMASPKQRNADVVHIGTRRASDNQPIHSLQGMISVIVFQYLRIGKTFIA